VFWHWKGKDGALQAPAEESKWSPICADLAEAF
jgi:hypothetical protein